MAVDLVLGTPLAEALIELVSSEIFEIGWSSERQGSLLAKAIVDKLACAETPRQFAKDLAFNMRPYGEDVEEFGQWLFEQAIRLADVHKDSSVSGTNNEIVPFATSAPFTFQIGSHKKEFTVHRNLLQRISEPLHVLMNGSMQEAQTGVALFEDIDEVTFQRFVSYAYALASLGVHSINVREESEAVSHYGSPAPTCMWCKKSISMSVRCTANHSDHPHTVDDYLWLVTTKKPGSRSEGQNHRSFAYEYVEDRRQWQNSQTSLASHAKLYNFAEKYLINNLKTVALICLRNDFINMDMLDFPIREGKNSLADFLDLLSLTFDADSEYAQEDDFEYSDMNDLQRLVSYFTVCKQAKLRKHRVFRELLIRNGQIGLVLLYASQEMLGTASE